MYLHVAQLLNSVRGDLVMTNNARGLVYVGRGVLSMSSILPSFVGHERWCGPNGRALRYKSMEYLWKCMFFNLDVGRARYRAASCRGRASSNRRLTHNSLPL
jgi:hypothetical protein